jgi:hypothetical protein
MCKYDHRNWSDLRLDPAMILFHGVVQVGTTTDLHGRLPAVVELIPHSHVAQRGVRGLVAIQRDPARLALVFQRLAKESLGRIHIPPATEMRLNRMAALVHRAVQVHPLAARLDIGRVTPPGSPHRPLNGRQYAAKFTA